MFDCALHSLNQPLVHLSRLHVCIFLHLKSPIEQVSIGKMFNARKLFNDLGFQASIHWWTVEEADKN